MTLECAIPKTFKFERAIERDTEAVMLMAGQPHDTTERFMQIAGDVAWIQVDTIDRATGSRITTENYRVDIELARRLMNRKIVTIQSYLPGLGGDRLELSEHHARILSGAEIVTCPKCGKQARPNGITEFTEYGPTRVNNVPHFWCDHGCTVGHEDPDLDWTYGFVLIGEKKIATSPNYPQ